MDFLDATSAFYTHKFDIRLPLNNITTENHIILSSVLRSTIQYILGQSLKNRK
jgi:hypothetical protein